MCNIMNGDASSVLKSLVELCGYGNSFTDPCSLFGILSAAHLTYLLAKSGVAAATGFYIPSDISKNSEILGELLLKDGKMSVLSAKLPNETSFLEELLLESVQRLNVLDFPLDVRL
jgi:hypothetical protein